MKEISNKEVVTVKYKKSLTSLKDQAHFFFDKIWLLKYTTREEAYQNLAEWLGVEEPKSHMSTMNEKTCRDVIYRSIQLLNDMRRLDLDFGAPIETPYYELIEPELLTTK